MGKKKRNRVGLRDRKLIRKGHKYKINEVLSQVVGSCNLRRKDASVDFDGDLIKMNSQRYILFARKGVTCVTCGLKGKYFRKERNMCDKTYHFNLYAVRKEDGAEILITKDHIISRSNGGKNMQNNYQVMCSICNNEKSITENNEVIELQKAKEKTMSYAKGVSHEK